LLPVGNGRLEAAVNLPEAKYDTLLKAAQEAKGSATAIEAASNDEDNVRYRKRRRKSSDGDEEVMDPDKNDDVDNDEKNTSQRGESGGAYSVSEAQAAYAHLSDYHKKKGWDTSGWWASKG
jgi:ubiquitin-conjugating enzyme E2 Q